MEVVKELKSTYLSRPHYQGAALASLFFFTLCVLASVFYWFHPQGELFLANGLIVFEGKEYYRLLTSVFIHGDLKHLLSNSLMLLILSYFVVQYYGSLKFFLYSFTAGVLTNYLTISLMDPNIGLLGASGVVYFLWGFWLTLYLFIHRTVPVGRRFMKIIAISVFLLIPSSFDPQVSYLAHGVGFLVGGLYGLTHFLANFRTLRESEQHIYTIDYWDEDEGLDQLSLYNYH